MCLARQACGSPLKLLSRWAKDRTRTKNVCPPDPDSDDSAVHVHSQKDQVIFRITRSLSKRSARSLAHSLRQGFTIGTTSERIKNMVLISLGSPRT